MAFEQEEPKKYPKPVDFDQLYPGRFLKAGELLGKKVTLTISAVDLLGLKDDNGATKAKAILSFKEAEKQMVACKTNGICLKEMFGSAVQEWVGKRITIFPDLWNDEPAIRVWGSPDIEREIEVTVTLPRRRPFKKVMHKVEKRAPAQEAAAN